MLFLQMLSVISLLLFISFRFSFALEPYNYVNNFIGSGGAFWGYGGISPAAQIPFGALRLGPDTTSSPQDYDWEHSSGYNSADRIIRAFSHTHLVGAGLSDLAAIGIMPISSSNFSYGSWWSSFSKSTEHAVPGFYSVHLEDSDINVESLALSGWAGIHRYRGKRLSAIVVDACHSALRLQNISNDRCLFASIDVNPENPNIFSVVMQTNGSLSGLLVTYLHGEIISTKNRVIEWKTFPSEISGSTSKTLYSFALFDNTMEDEETTVEVRVGISFISLEIAEKNLQNALIMKENFSNSFDELFERTKRIWKEAMNVVTVTPIENDPDFLTIFYSSIYRSLLSPTNYTESNGLYLGVDKQIHNVKEERMKKYGEKNKNQSSDTAAAAALPSFLQNNQFSYFSDFSFWDTFRTVHPWYLLINEDLTMGFARSILEITFQQNAFPRWVLASYDSSCMNGIHGFSLFIELLHAGYINEFVDFKALHSLLLKQLTTEWPLNGRIDIENYLKLGYIPIESAKTAPSLSLSNYFDDYLFGIFSMYLNEIEIGTEAFNRSLNFQTIWSAKDKLFCPKSINGSISCPENPTSPFALSNYVEGNALHYSYDVLHNIHHLIQLYSSRKEFQDTLEEFMMEHVKYHVKIGNEAVNPYFWMGNEHDFHVPWLFNYLPQGCVETQYWTRNLTFYHFTTSPDLGLPGNDDYGTTSVWLILASLGIYPIPGSSLFYLSSPRISTATIHVNHWKDSSLTKLEMITYNNSLENRYVQKLLINGKEITQPFIERSVLIRRNEDVKVEFFMHDQPNSRLCP